MPSAQATAVLTINEPAGEDAKVWEMIRAFEKEQRARYRFTSDRYKVAGQIRKLYPGSSYIPYLAGEGVDSREANDEGQICAFYEELIEVMPDRFLRAQVALAYAGTLASWAQQGEGDTPEETIAYGGRARDLLTGIDKSWRDEDLPGKTIADRMREVRGKLLTPDEYRKRFKEVRE